MIIKGLKKTSGMTRDFGPYSGHYIEIFFDRKTCEVWGVWQYSLGHNTWTEYHDPNVIKICNTDHHMKMVEIAEAISECLKDR